MMNSIDCLLMYQIKLKKISNPYKYDENNLPIDLKILPRLGVAKFSVLRIFLVPTAGYFLPNHNEKPKSKITEPLFQYQNYLEN